MPDWQPETYQAVTLGAAVVAGLCLLLLLFTLARLRALGRRVRRLGGRRRGHPRAGTDPGALRHVAVVRYDAFGDMGGRLSFSAALLDDSGDGLVLTLDQRAVRDPHLRQGLVGLQSDHSLSPEEQQAIAMRQADAPRLGRPPGAAT